MGDHSDLSKVRIPFTAYDVFGYVIPGSVFLVTVLLFDLWGCYHGLQHTPVLTFLKTASKLPLAHDVAAILVYALAMAVLAYTVGHLIATLSSLFLDRILIEQGYGYPYEFLLAIDPSRDLRHPATRPFYRGAFFWLNAYVVGRYCNHVLFGPGTAWTTWMLNAVGVLMALATLGMIIGSMVRSRNATPLHKYFYVGRGAALRNAYKTIVAGPLVWPYECLSRPLALYLQSRRAFRGKFLEQYRERFEGEFGLNVDEAGTNNYWLSYCYVVDRSPVFAAMIGNWLHLYGFARNLSVAFYLAFFYAFVTLRLQPLSPVDDVAKIVPLALLAAAGLLLVRYYYLYVCYYSKFIFRAFVYLATQAQKRGGT